jgi:adenylosuccinate lyase
MGIGQLLEENERLGAALAQKEAELASAQERHRTQAAELAEERLKREVGSSMMPHS